MLFHSLHKFSAASGQNGNKNEKPLSINLRGTTLRLFRINSVSDRKKNAANSSINSVEGKPILWPQAFRIAAINSAFGNGFGADKFTASSNSGREINQ